jgi:enoyl-CoA hydratase/carnithine racemase
LVQHDVMRSETGSVAAPVEETEELLVEERGSLGLVTLNRPRALNALNEAMRAKLAAAYPNFARNPQIYAVVIQSASEKAFCAGGDVRELIRWGRDDRERGRKAFANEYALDWLHECFSKPTVSLIDGAVMGSGVGITQYGTHRVAGPKYKFAMPETAIGLFPDVGAVWKLSRLPDSIGMYLGLTGHAIGRADAYALGLLTHCIDPAQFEEIKAQLADTWPVDALLDARHADPGPGALPEKRETIASCFSAGTVEEIVARLEAVAGADREWAQGVAADLRTRSPLSLKITHRHIREAAAMDLRQTLVRDYRLAWHFLEGEDFYEGVRAVLVDKDGKPRWNPSRLEDVSSAMVDDYFTSLGAIELELPTRQEMQAARV